MQLGAWCGECDSFLQQPQAWGSVGARVEYDSHGLTVYKVEAEELELDGLSVDITISLRFFAAMIVQIWIYLIILKF